MRMAQRASRTPRKSLQRPPRSAGWLDGSAASLTQKCSRTSSTRSAQAFRTPKRAEVRQRMLCGPRSICWSRSSLSAARLRGHAGISNAESQQDLLDDARRRHADSHARLERVAQNLTILEQRICTDEATLARFAAEYEEPPEAIAAQAKAVADSLADASADVARLTGLGRRVGERSTTSSAPASALSESGGSRLCGAVRVKRCSTPSSPLTRAHAWNTTPRTSARPSSGAGGSQR